MKAISVLGTSSNAGKSWLVTALGAWLHRQGVRVAPFKAQNMSNNSYVTLEGGEIGRAQAAQAFACGLRPVAEMNPVLLKPSGNSTSQLVLLGQPKDHIPAREYYRHVDSVWQVVRDTLDNWRDRCDVLVLEGAGSPVELNLIHRDIVNLRPVEYLQGRWMLVGDIERGGIFAQAVGTYHLVPPSAKSLGLGLVVNKFRGDLSLFADAGRYFQEHLPDLPYLGTLPYCSDLQPESEDSLCREAEEKGTGEILAWIRFPYLSNSQDSQPWQLDEGVRVKWVGSPSELSEARAIVLPGSKNTLRDLAWLRETGLAEAIVTAFDRGIPIVGICGGYQMLGRKLIDDDGIAGDAGTVEGLGLLPAVTRFARTKSVRQVSAQWQDDRWTAYEIHMGQTEAIESVRSLLHASGRDEGMQIARDRGANCPRVWGTYLHGLFESSAVRQELMQLAGVVEYRPSPQSWQTVQQTLYDRMADCIDRYLDLDRVRQYLEL
ncbi:MAG: cobyric acid synthase [Cyanobacteria bacterium SID2]|nr:cobyric acid synthase [Cyanobacteria bacterium SID2]MBP0004670.1 cobyric acid synthase [Cyanobacteria bacterium SBC]